jgi:adenosine deaminase/CheY-like chemotaxis protein
MGEYVYCDFENNKFDSVNEVIANIAKNENVSNREEKNDLVGRKKKLSQSLSSIYEFTVSGDHPHNAKVVADNSEDTDFNKKLERFEPKDCGDEILKKEHFCLLRQLAVLSMLGKGNRTIVDNEVKASVPWLEEFSGSFAVRRARTIEATSSIANAGAADKVANIYKGVRIERRTEVYRDLGRWLSHGIIFWANERQVNNKKIRILIIDDVLLWDNEENSEGEKSLCSLFVQQLSLINKMTGTTPENPLWEIDAIKIKNWKDVEDWIKGKVVGENFTLSSEEYNANKKDEYENVPYFKDKRDDNSIVETVTYFKKTDNTLKASETLKAEGVGTKGYDFILTDIVYRTSQPGAYAVRRITDFLEQQARRQVKDNEISPPAMPRVVVLTREMDLQSISQCLDAGADLYLEKTRIFQLPVRMRELLLSPKYLRSYSTVAQFKVMDQILPGMRARLDSDDLQYRINDNQKSKKWIAQLPKTDLHLHMGTCIRPKIIESLALNTIGYLTRNISTNSQSGIEKRNEKVFDHFQCIANSILKSFSSLNDIRGKSTGEKVKEFCDTLSREISRIESVEKSLNGKTLPKYGDMKFWDETIKHLTPTDQHIHLHEVAGFVVAVIAFISQGNTYKQSAEKEWGYLSGISNLLSEENTENNEGNNDAKPDGLLKHLRHNAKSILYQSAANMPYSNHNTPPKYSNGNGSDDFIVKRVELRCDAAWELLTLMLEDNADTIEDIRKERCLSFHDIVQCYGSSLREYLSGAGLLGAEHLQYPENILLATQDIVLQNMEDNVIYSEVRCETTGYTRGGMTAQNATMTLLLGFDIAALFHYRDKYKKWDEEQKSFKSLGSAKPTWVRVNVLLGAKRHKDKSDIRSIVQLLANELQRSRIDESLLREDDENPSTTPPNWWLPSSVVGFDLSGDEKAEKHSIKDIMEFLEPLYKESAPITIHAGEAADAASIWQAVFQLGARRIGHGLRLREQPRLLEHCVTRRICMEMCPVSNSMTNSFGIARRESDKPGMRFIYPILYYINAGMDVCINTDNRFIHPIEQSTVTSEYLTAAEMSGFLTRSEVLSMVCAGFRNAFLHEADANRLMSHVESEIYSLLVGSTIQYT